MTASASVKKLLPWLVAVAFFKEAQDTTILNTAVPVMAQALGVVPLSMKSVLSSYTLSLALFIPISSWMADRFGTRRVFGSAIGLFSLGSLLCGISNNIHLLVACRILQGCGGAMMVPVGRLTLVRAFPKSELIRAMSFVAIPALIGPMLGPLAGGLIVGWFHWRVIFFVNLPIGALGLYLVHRYLPDYRAARSDKLDLSGLILFGSGIALLSYILEVFGENRLGGGVILGLLVLAFSLLGCYGWHARHTVHPLLRLGLLRIRTLRVSVVGNFITRLGVGGMPFLLPLLFQIGLGYSPIESGLLIMPQSLSALCLKMLMPHILSWAGYRKVLLYNTIALGASLTLFALVKPGTPAVVIVILGTVFGFLSSMQYTSMNTLGYADVSEADTSMASTIMSTVQQMSISFGVAVASLVTAYFVPDRHRSSDWEMIQGMHHAFIFLGLTTAGSAIAFNQLKDDDGDNVSLHKSPTLHV